MIYITLSLATIDLSLRALSYPENLINKDMFTHIIIMNQKALFLCSLCLLSLVISTPSFSFLAFAQTSPPAPATGASRLIQKIEKIPSLSNVVGISLVDGIKVSGVSIGDNNLTVTLTAGGNVTSSGNASLPITIVVTKLPISNTTQLLSTVESTFRLAAANRLTGPLESGAAAPSGAMGSDALQILQLLRNVKVGTGSIVNANWTLPQTISVGLLGFGIGSSVGAFAPSDIVLVTVVPFQGKR
jgi:hypothetical protein